MNSNFMTNKFKFHDENNNDDLQQEVLDKKLSNLKNNKPNYTKLQTKNAGLFGLRHTPDYNSYNENDTKYDFYGNFLNESGINVNNNNITRYKTTYLNIDSNKRKKNINFTTDLNINLNINSLELNNNSTYMGQFPFEKRSTEMLIKKQVSAGSLGQDPTKRTIAELLVNSIINIDKPAGPTSHQTSEFVKIIEAIETLERTLSNYLKHLTGTDGLYEARIQLGSNIWRVFCFFDGDKLVVLMNGFQKNYLEK
jgi:hypothetical protein